MNPNIIELDFEATERFRLARREPLQIPDALLEEYRLRQTLDQPKKSQVKIIRIHNSPQAEYQNAEGYKFSWGHILERRLNQFIILDFCFPRLLSRFHRKALRLDDLQRVMFAELSGLDHINADAMTGLGLTEGWVVLPGSSISAFTEVIHFASEEPAREWTAESLIQNALPQAIARAQAYLDGKAW